MSFLRIFATIVLLTNAVSLTAQTGPSKIIGRNSYKSLLGGLLRAQATTSAAQKVTALEDWLTGSSIYADDNRGGYDKIDTARYKYSGIRGSMLSSSDDYTSPSYRDNSNTLFFEGLQDPASSTLSYDTGHLDFLPGTPAYYKMVKTYNAAGALAAYSMFVAQSPGGPFTPYEAYQYFYNAARHCIRRLPMHASGVPAGLGVFTTWSGNQKTLDSLYDFTNGAPYEKIAFTNNAAGKPTLVFAQNWSGTAWINEARNMFTYDGLNRVVTAEHHDWISGAWQIQTRDSFGYTGAGGTYTYRAVFGWDATKSGFIQSASGRAKLNAFGAMDTLYHYIGTNTIPNGRYIFSYNSYQHLTALLSYGYNGSTYSARPGEKYLYYYQTYNATEIPNEISRAGADDLTIAPNPVSGNGDVRLHLSSAPAHSPRIAVFDATGRLVKSLMGAASQAFSISVKELPAGVYQVVVNSDGRVSRGRFVK